MHSLGSVQIADVAFSHSQPEQGVEVIDRVALLRGQLRSHGERRTCGLICAQLAVIQTKQLQGGDHVHLTGFRQSGIQLSEQASVL